MYYSLYADKRIYDTTKKIMEIKMGNFVRMLIVFIPLFFDKKMGGFRGDISSSKPETILRLSI